jgi:hypothetical protein
LDIDSRRRRDGVVFCIVAPKTCDCKGSDNCSGQPVRFDTIVVTKERKLTDTIVMNDVDTITIERDRVRVRLVRSYDTLMVEGTCLPDTIKIDVIREIPQVVQPRRWRDQFNLWLSVVLLIFSIAFAASRWRR